MDHTDKSGMRVKGNLAVLGENKVFYAGAHVGRKRSTCLNRGIALRWLMWWQDGHLYEEFLEAETGWKVCTHSSLATEAHTARAQANTTVDLL